MKGYKAFYFDLSCRPFATCTMMYEIGGTYKIDGAPIICRRGFHFCQVLDEIYEYYPARFDIRVCEVEALGDCDWGICPSCVSRDVSSKVATNELRIIRELEPADIMDALNDIRTNTFYKRASTLPAIRSSIRIFNNTPSFYPLWEDNGGCYRLPKDDRETQWLRQRAQLWVDVLPATKTNKEEKKE